MGHGVPLLQTGNKQSLCPGSVPERPMKKTVLEPSRLREGKGKGKEERKGNVKRKKGKGKREKEKGKTGK